MIGLPLETFNDVKNSVDFINHHNVQGIKIHSTYVVKNTVWLICIIQENMFQFLLTIIWMLGLCFNSY